MKAEKQDGGVLSGILAESAVRADALRPRRADLERAAADAGPVPPFARALRGPAVAVIAEVKRRSPSAGAIREQADAGDLARAYVEAGAAAISVLTEPVHFSGSLGDLETVAALGRPCLRKDFIVDEVQLLEARIAGASAALLIARAFSPARLRDLLAYAGQARLEALVEVHSPDELRAAEDAGAEIIGVNARDLETLRMDQGLIERLLPRIAGAVRVAESGIRSRADVERAAALGADAVLVGTALAGASDPGRAVRELTDVRRKR